MSGASAAMVKAMIVKGGGAVVKGGNMTCEQIFASFDPPIKFGSHKDMVGKKKGYQAEHIVPTSTFHIKGRGGDCMKGCKGYSTPNALTWLVRDGQSKKQEHKLLTDPMREFSQKNGDKKATLNQWLDKYKEGVKNALKNASPKRKIKNSKLDEDSLIEAAAECIRARAAEAFAAMKPPVKGNTELRNSWPAKSDKTAVRKGGAPSAGPVRKSK